MITVRKHWELIPAQMGCLVFGFGSSWLFIRWGWGIQGVALASLLLAFAQFAALSALSLRYVYSLKESAIFYLKVMAAFSYFTLSLYGIDRHLFTSWGIEFRVVMNYLAFLLLMAPLVYAAEKEARVLSTLRGLFRQK
jgi:hypothetical protein